MGYGEGSMKLPYSHLAQSSCATRVGDLVGFVGDVNNELVGLGVVVRAFPRNSVIRWVNTGQYVSEKNTNLYIIAEGSRNVVQAT
jgi:hypothetical protein